MTTINVEFVDAITIDNAFHGAGTTAALLEALANQLVQAGHAIIVDSAGQTDIDAANPEATQAMADELSRGLADGDPQDTPGAVEIE